PPLPMAGTGAPQDLPPPAREPVRGELVRVPGGVGVLGRRREMRCLGDSRRPPPDVEAREVSPALDFGIEACLVRNFVRVNLLRADEAGLPCPVSGPHVVWRRHEHSALKQTADGAEKRPGVITVFFGATGNGPPRVQGTSSTGDEAPRLVDA